MAPKLLSAPLFVAALVALAALVAASDVPTQEPAVNPFVVDGPSDETPRSCCVCPIRSGMELHQTLFWEGMSAQHCRDACTNTTALFESAYNRRNPMPESPCDKSFPPGQCSPFCSSKAINLKVVADNCQPPEPHQPDANCAGNFVCGVHFPPEPRPTECPLCSEMRRSETHSTHPFYNPPVISSTEPSRVLYAPDKSSFSAVELKGFEILEVMGFGDMKKHKYCLTQRDLVATETWTISYGQLIKANKYATAVFVLDSRQQRKRLLSTNSRYASWATVVSQRQLDAMLTGTNCSDDLVQGTTCP